MQCGENSNKNGQHEFFSSFCPTLCLSSNILMHQMMMIGSKMFIYKQDHADCRGSLGVGLACLRLQNSCFNVLRFGIFKSFKKAFTVFFRVFLVLVLDLGLWEYFLIHWKSWRFKSLSWPLEEMSWSSGWLFNVFPLHHLLSLSWLLKPTELAFKNVD